MTRTDRITSRLAAAVGIQHLGRISQANTAQFEVDRKIRAIWNRLLRALRQPDGQQQAKQILDKLFLDIQAAIQQSLTGLVRSAYDGQREALQTEMPPYYLAAALASRNRPRFFREDVGGITLGIKRGGRLGEIGPKPSASPDEDEQRQILADMLFPPLPQDQILGILRTTVDGRTWQQEFQAATRLAGPLALSTTLAIGFSQGETPQQVAARLRPEVEGVSGTARRLARTYGMKMANGAAQQATDALGDLVIGQQVHAQLDQHTRPWHAARNGTIYYKEPKPGDKGMPQMPHPPLEAEDARERPAGTPSTAWNCRCWTAPVLRPPQAIQQNPELLAKFQTAQEQTIPDPVVYSQWFQQAGERERQQAVGARRYAAAADRLGRSPEWEDMLDPRDGSLLSLERINGESDADRMARAAKVRDLIGRRKDLILSMAQYGFKA